MRFVPLTNGRFAKVDDPDFEKVSKFKWRMASCRGGTGNEYAVTYMRIDGELKIIYMHRYITGSSSTLDHKNGDSLDNRRENLRAATRVENGRNRKLQVHSAPYKGVSLFKASKTPKWQAYGAKSGKNVHLGYFQSPELAAEAYDNFALANYGQFARTNQQMRYNFEI